jgi:hypothetical protein
MCVFPTPGSPHTQMANLSAAIGKMERGMLFSIVCPTAAEAPGAAWGGGREGGREGGHYSRDLRTWKEEPQVAVLYSQRKPLLPSAVWLSGRRLVSPSSDTLHPIHSHTPASLCLLTPPRPLSLQAPPFLPNPPLHNKRKDISGPSLH